MFEYYAERGLTHEYDETTEWECLVDAVYTFSGTTADDCIKHNSNNTNNSGTEAPSVRCIFTRVYLDDMDLIKMGNQNDDDDRREEAAEQQSSHFLSSTIDEAPKPTTTSDGPSSSPPLASSAAAAAVGQAHDDGQHATTPMTSTTSEKMVSDQDNHDNRRSNGTVAYAICSNGNTSNNNDGMAPRARWLPLHVYRRQKILRNKLKQLRYSLTPDGEISMLEQNFGPLSDVQFEKYTSLHRWNKEQIRYPKCSPFSEENSEEGGRWETAQNAVSTSSSSSSSSSSTENGDNDGTGGEGGGGGGGGAEHNATNLSSRKKRKTVSSELLNFDFGFCPTRDAKLVAKNADKHFAKDKVMFKYWYQRNRFFSKLNEGILMDREGWFSVTPERVACHVADRVVLLRDCTVLDPFTGVGGNAIQFAMRGAYVIAVDIDPVKLRCARQNARVYGVEKRICFICGSFFHVAASMFGARDAKEQKEAQIGYSHGVDAVFLSPPWGGPAYLRRDRPFDLRTDMEPNGVDIFRVAQQISPNIAYFLPKNTRTDQLIALAGPGGRVELEQTVLNEKVKALHAFYGLLAAT